MTGPARELLHLWKSLSLRNQQLARRFGIVPDDLPPWVDARLSQLIVHEVPADELQEVDRRLGAYHEHLELRELADQSSRRET